jgi:protein disulfide-isomerase A1
MGTPFAYIFTDTANTVSEDLRTELGQLARQYRGKLQFSIAPVSTIPSIVQDMHFQSTPLPAFAIREPISNLRYPMPASKSLSSHAFCKAAASFSRRYLAGELPLTIKSEPIPPASPSALVKVVGQTYTSIVHDSNRDVLLVFSIEVCAPCERLYPVLEDLAERYRVEEGMQQKTTIATVLHDKNDTGLRNIRAFPTIMLFPARNKRSPVRYLGKDRTAEGLKDFMEKNGSL